jgi:hypothetical protein
LFLLLLLHCVPPSVQVDFMIDETLPRMVAWGLLQQHGPQQYSLVPLTQALHNLTAYWQRMQQPAAAEGSTSGGAAAGHCNYSLSAGPPATAAGGGAAGRMLVGCVGLAAAQHCHGGGSGIGGRVLAQRMPARQLQRQRVVPYRLARGAACATAAAAAGVKARQGLVAAGQAGMRPLMQL